MSVARFNHTATLLRSGKVLITGGRYSSTGGLSSAELYDPASGTFSATGSMREGRWYHTATLLQNGKVLVAGGTPDNNTSMSSAELYDPASGTFSAAGSMRVARNFHVAVLLPNGNVLLAGGGAGRGSATLASAELYDPSAGTFSTTGSMSAPRQQYSASLLRNGKVLVIGGSTGSANLSSAELYDPAAGLFSATGAMNSTRCRHSATLLPNGKVLVTGGVSSDRNITVPTAELYDPSAGGFSVTGSMGTPRQGHTATLLPNGKVLVAAGNDGYGALPPPISAELYDPGVQIFSAAGPMNGNMCAHTATLLSNGKVLVTGGNAEGGNLSSAELYDFRGKSAVFTAALSTRAVSAAKPPESAKEPDVRAAPAARARPAYEPPVLPRAAKLPGVTNVAVADFMGKNVSQADASIVTDFLRTELVNSKLYKVMDRSNMETVLAEQKFQNSGCTEQECAVEMGKLLNVRRMYVGSLSKLLDSYYVTVNVVDVSTGEIVASYNSDAVSSKKLKDACKKAVAELSGK